MLENKEPQQVQEVRALVRPNYVFIFGWVVWLCFFLISPYNYTNINPIEGAVLLLLLYNFSFLLGMYSVRKRKYILQNVTEASPKAINKLLTLTNLIGIIGATLNLYVKLRVAVEFSLNDLSSNRDQILEAGELSGGILSIISALMYPFCYCSLIICMFYKKYFSKSKYIISLLISFMPVITIVILGGRSTLFFYIITIMFCQIINLYNTNKVTKIYFGSQILFTIPKNIMSKKVLINICIFIILSLTVFLYIQQDRVDKWEVSNLENFHFWSKGQEWKYDHEHPINALFGSASPSEYVGLLNFIHYNVHGVMEYIRLYNHSESIFGYYYGKYEFYVFIKVLKPFGFNTGKDFISMSNQVMHKPAVYTTFWGPFFIDFGIFGVFIIFFAGRIIKRMFYKFYSGNSSIILFYPYFLTIIFTIPFFHSFSGSNLYYFIAIIITIFMYRTLTKKKRAKTLVLSNAKINQDAFHPFD
jgi:oligosaccharide repeat unit polymerase